MHALIGRALGDCRLSKPLNLPVFTTPRTRADCALLPRPCPFSSSCRYGLERDDYATSRDGTGERHEAAMARRRLNGVTESCALDVADRGPQTADQVALYLGVNEQAIVQFEDRFMPKLAKRFRRLKSAIE